jgi:ABC-2 type transport system permease protein
MNIHRVMVLFAKEARAGLGNFLVVFALVIPVILSLLVSLIFGNLFSARPRLGFYDPAGSEFVRQMAAQSHISTRLYDRPEDLIEDVRTGIIQTGLMVPVGFDGAIQAGASLDMDVYTWGETPFRDRLIADTAIANVVGHVAGLPRNVSVEIVQLGKAGPDNIGRQMLPLLVLMTIILGGVLVPAIGIIDEKLHKTLAALTVTPASLVEIFFAKGLLGVLIGSLTGLITLLINNAFGNNPALLMAILVFAAIVSAALGVLLGALLKEMQVLLAVLKAGGILLFAPGALEFVPQAPNWIARLFPTYYLLNPLMAVAERGAGLREVLPDLAVMVIMLLAMLFVLARMLSHQEKKVALLG